MTRRNRTVFPTAIQKAARQELHQVAVAHAEKIRIIRTLGVDEQGGLHFVVRLFTHDLLIVPNGLPVSSEHEDVVIRIPAAFPWQPPEASVSHQRFVGQPHVLVGQVLCIYLDPAREWHPYAGLRGFLSRLWDWFVDGATGKFEPRTALYHPVGGVLHRTPGTPTIVIREPLAANGKKFLQASLTTRSETRLDLAGWNTKIPGAQVALVLVLPSPLPFGAGRTLSELIQVLRLTDYLSPTVFLTALAQATVRNPAGTPCHVIFAVPHPAQLDRYHLLVGRLAAPLTDRLRTAAKHYGALLDIDPTSVPPNIPIEWCPVSDERPDMTTRRDSSTQVSRFAAKTVEIWGCGGLGSWIGEFVTRAGAARVILRDPGNVHGGLLVRQNFAETDVGGNKADRLADRLRAIADNVEIESHPLPAPAEISNVLPSCDVLIDATVNVGVSAYLDAAAQQLQGVNRTLLAQVTTDVRTATLGVLTVSAPGTGAGPGAIDSQVHSTVLEDSTLERFHILWQEPMAGDEIVPAPGCSVPTFHGSAADVAAVAASLVSLLGLHFDAPASGVHLIALPHAPGKGPSHHFVPAADTSSYGS